MIGNPFALFAPLEDQVVVHLFTKEDNIRTEEDIVDALSIPDIAALEQVHGDRIIRVDGPLARTEEADGMITDTPNLVLTVRTADCQSFAIYVPEKNILGVLHVGWRGLDAGAIPAFCKSLQDDWNVAAEKTFVAAGPSLCTLCAKFTSPQKELPSIDPQFLRGRHVDLQGAAEAQFMEHGVRPGNFERYAGCTRCDPETYWTYRGGDHDAVEMGYTNVLACALRA